MKFSGRSSYGIAMLVILTALIGCSGGGGGDSAAGGTGSLSLSLTDAATLDYRAVYVTIARVDVHLDRGGEGPNSWKTVATPRRTYNLLELVNGVMENLSISDLEAGIYTQMRLIIGTDPDREENILGALHPYANYIILAGTDAIHELFVPSGVQTGIKLVKNFTITAGETRELILDFDAARSVVKAGASGKWLLKPTIKVIDSKTHSILEGAVVDQDGNPLQNVLVSAQASLPSADDRRDTVVIEASSPTDKNGRFKILARPGTYNIVAYKEKYDYDFECGVQAAAGETIALGYFLLLSLESSDYGEVEGEVSVTGGGEVTMSFRAKGECEGNIEVKSISIDSGGSYELILPIGTYEVIAWSDGKDTVMEEVEIESGPNIIDMDIVTMQ